MTQGRPTLWSPAPAPPTLGSNDVHVWRAVLDLPPSRLHVFQRLLSPEEHARAGRFYLARDRERFIAARGLLRSILGIYLGREPGHLIFLYNPYGKPSLATEPGSGQSPDCSQSPDPCARCLRFNLSHSEGLALYAVTRSREVGVDIEWIGASVFEEGVAERFFAPAEVRALRGVPAAEQPEAFYRCWTRKEAYIKARGQGLSIPLSDFTVSLAPDEPAALLSVEGDPAEVGRWSLRDLVPGRGYMGAVAAEGRDWRLQCWEWLPETT